MCMYGIPNKLIFYTVIIHREYDFKLIFVGEISGCLQRDKQFIRSVAGVWRIYTTLLLGDLIYLNIGDEPAIRSTFGSLARWR